MKEKKKNNNIGIGDFVWRNLTNDSGNMYHIVEKFCKMSDGSTPSKAEKENIQTLLKNPYVRLIFDAAHEAGYDSF